MKVEAERYLNMKIEEERERQAESVWESGCERGVRERASGQILK